VDKDDEILAVKEAPEDATDFEGQTIPQEEARRPSLSTVLGVFAAEMGIPAEHLAGGGRRESCRGTAASSPRSPCRGWVTR